MIVLTVWNLIVFFVYGIDKLLARKRKRRISERTLVLLSFLFASLGATFGMVVFNHKTSKMKFRLLIPLSFFVNIIILYLIKKWMLN